MARRATSDQLPLHLPLQAASAREDLLVTPANSDAVSFLDSWPDWPGPVGILAGPTGSGKTHLAHIWAARSDARFLAPPLDGDSAMPEAGEAVVVEDVAQGSFSETWLFHVWNAVREGGGSMLLTSRRWPGDWGVALPDLKSRLKLAHLMEIHEPDEALLSGVMAKLFADRQIFVDAAVIDYLALRIERSLASAQTVVAAVDRLALSQKRAVTVPLAAQALRDAGLPQ